MALIQPLRLRGALTELISKQMQHMGTTGNVENATVPTTATPRSAQLNSTFAALSLGAPFKSLVPMEKVQGSF